MKKELIKISVILLIPNLVTAGVMGETVADMISLLYGIAAGFAVLLIVVHGVKWKTATNPAAREEAKKGIIMVILALLIIIIAGTIVTMIYKLPAAQPHPTITARNWQSILPDDQMSLELTVDNSLNYTLSNIKVKVFTLNYSLCLEDDLSDSKPLPDIIAAGSEVYSHDNFCADGNKFDVSLECDQNFWDYCVECAACPPAASGSCGVSIGSC